MKPAYVVALIEKDDLILSVSRRGKPNDLGLPGGSIEPGEMPYLAMLREVSEETGLDVVDASLVFERVDSTDGKIAWTYRVNEFMGKARNMEPGIDVSWRKPEELLAEVCTFREYNQRLFDLLGIT